jgi:hypothetical protein
LNRPVLEYILSRQTFLYLFTLLRNVISVVCMAFISCFCFDSALFPSNIAERVYVNCRLGGVVVSVLAIGRKVTGFKTG